jgi:hypothetical protein
VYHLELRQFPHSLSRFNLDEQGLRAIVEPWTREPWVEVGERKWSPHQAKLTVLRGPQIPVEELSLGRGWRTAQRQSEDVTERVLAAAGQAGDAASRSLPQHPPPDASLAADSLGLELLALLGDGPAPLSRAWRLAAGRFPELSPGESLTLAERAVGSLLKGRLIVLLHAASSDAHGDPDSGRGGAEVEDAELGPLLRSLDSWAEPGGSGGIRMRRA